MPLLLLHLLLRLLLPGLVTVRAGLSSVRVTVPQYPRPGEMTELRCSYNLGGDILYSVKWYKDHEEFYRFMPKGDPPKRSYHLDGMPVDLSMSDSERVVLRQVTLKSSGLYRCEVSAEAPSFSSAQSEGLMEVVYLPEEDPKITGVDLQYQIGDEINLNCTSGKSHPAPVLHWYINEQQVVGPNALIQYPPSFHKDGLVSSTLGLRFLLSSRHFAGGSMRVRCVASVSPHYWKGGSESVVQKHSPLVDNREALLLVRSGGQVNTSICSMIIVLMVSVLVLT